MLRQMQKGIWNAEQKSEDAFCISNQEVTLSCAEKLKIMYIRHRAGTKDKGFNKARITFIANTPFLISRYFNIEDADCPVVLQKSKNLFLFI